METEKRLPSRGRRRRGGAVVEAAAILPLLLLFFFGILEYSRWLMTIQTVHNAVVQGAEYAAKHTDPIVLGGTTYQPTDYSKVITQYLAGLSLQNQAISIYQSDALGNNLGVWTGADRDVRLRADYRQLHLHAGEAAGLYQPYSRLVQVRQGK